VAAVEVDFVDPDFAHGCAGVEEDCASLGCAVEDDGGDWLVLAGLLVDGLGEDFVVRVVGEGFEGVGVGGDEGELVLSGYICSIRKQ
jgi:hypothetical protein